MFRLSLFLSLLFTILLVSCSSNTGMEPVLYTPCKNGFAGEYPCNNIDLYAHVDISELSGEHLNDIWGWIDPETGKEYAIVGLNNGVDIVDVTNPVEPVVVGNIPEVSSSTKGKISYQLHDDGGFGKKAPWRDVKVHKNVLYIVSDQAGYGLQIFDLTHLRSVNKTPTSFQKYSRYTGFGNAHNIAVNHETEYLYVVGSTAGSMCANHGSLQMIDISEPLQPKFAGCYYEARAGGIIADGYIHDTQCVIYKGPDQTYQGKEVCFSSSENVFLVTDVSDKQNASTISIATYPQHAYIHQGWLSDDQRYFFSNDELDEKYIYPKTRTFVWNVEDLDAPQMIGYYQHNTISIDHNLYIQGGMMYEANYTAGLHILDVSNPQPKNIVEVGYFDTTPHDNTITFEGLWSVYPWLSGDKIIVSDIENGLFILKFDR